MNSKFKEPPPPITPLRGSSSILSTNYYPKPDYKKYAQLLEWSESVAAALCCGFDYNGIKGFAESSSFFRESPGPQYLHMKAAFHAAIMAKSPNAYWHRMENGERMVKPAHYLAWALSMNFNPPQELINEVHLVVKKVWPQSEQSAPQASVEDLQKRIAELEKQLTDAATITLDKHNSIKRNVILPYMLDLFLKANNYSTKSAAAQAFIEKYGANPKTHKLVLDLQKKDNSVMDVASLLRMCRAQ